MSTGVVIPTFNEEENLKQLIPGLQQLINGVKVFVIDDMSKDKTVEVARSLGAIVPYTLEKRGFARSLIEGITMAHFEFNCDTVIQMDADHRIEDLKSFIDCPGNEDLLLGSETKGRTVRGTAVWLAKHFAGLDYSHPTCGLRLWRLKALEAMPWRNIKARGFSVQIETLFYAKEKKLSIREVYFIGGEHKPFQMRRLLEWLFTLERLTSRRLHLS